MMQDALGLFREVSEALGVRVERLGRDQLHVSVRLATRRILLVNHHKHLVIAAVVRRAVGVPVVPALCHRAGTEWVRRRREGR